jgi:transcriptional regulator GlxA family with amidase domain
VEAEMHDSQFSVERLAEAVNLGPRQLRRRLQALTRLSPSGYIRQLRLQRAVQLLEQQAGRISEVAYAVGFQNAEHFSRLFQQIYGVSPSQYKADRR